MRSRRRRPCARPGAPRREGWPRPAGRIGSTSSPPKGDERYDESASRRLGDTAELLLEEYGGDLRKLREAAGRDVDQEPRRLQRFKGIGKVGAEIFLARCRVRWDEVRPFADAKVLRASRRLGIGGDARALARRVPAKDLPRLASALVRVDLENAYEEVRRAAA